ncbi:MAG: hypothetical protein ABI969_13735 [bacterium]
MRLLPHILLALGGASVLTAQAPAPPLSAFMMTRDAEVALAKSAAPDGISARASIKLLTKTGYQVAHEGDNGFVCLVLRGWSAPTYTPASFRQIIYDPKIRAPICYNPAAARSVLPLQELRASLGMSGKAPDQIAEGVQSAYAKGEIPRVDGMALAYMFSADQYLGPGIAAWHPHIMLFTPYANNATLGDNAFAGTLPFVSDDAGTPFAVTVIPVAHDLAVKAGGGP